MPLQPVPDRFERPSLASMTGEQQGWLRGVQEGNAARAGYQELVELARRNRAALRTPLRNQPSGLLILPVELWDVVTFSAQVQGDGCHGQFYILAAR